jgi:hypothetical protein
MLALELSGGVTGRGVRLEPRGKSRCTSRSWAISPCCATALGWLPSSKKTRALLAYLAVRSVYPQERTVWALQMHGEFVPVSRAPS